MYYQKGDPKQLYFLYDGHQFVSPWFYGDPDFEKFLKVCLCIEPGNYRYAGVCGRDITDAYSTVAELERHIKIHEGLDCASVTVWDVTEFILTQLKPEPIPLCSHCFEGHLLMSKEVFV